MIRFWNVYSSARSNFHSVYAGRRACLCWLHPMLIADALEKRVADEAQMAAELEQMLDLLMRGLKVDS